MRSVVDRACVRLVIALTGLMSDRAAYRLHRHMYDYWTGERGQRVLRDLHAGRD